MNYAVNWQDAVSNPTGVIPRIRAIMRNTYLNISSYLDNKTENHSLRGLYCHYVFDNQINDFEELIISLKTLGKFITTEKLLDILNGKTSLDDRYFHLSFDDGFRNNFTNALPILSKYEVPAIFFVPTSLVEAEWKLTQTYCIETTKYKSVIEMLKWNDLRQMSDMGYEIGSHTRTHARFSAISFDRNLMEHEIKGSKLDLEQKLGTECKYISWPYGRITDSNDISLSVVQGSGYKACFGAYRGKIIPGITNKLSIPRHHFEVQWPLSHTLYFARGNMEKN